MDNMNILNDEAFNAIEPERLEAFRAFYENLNGKATEEIIAEVIKFNNSMPKGKSLSRAEKNAIIAAVLKRLSPNEQNRVEMMLKMMEGFMN